MAPFLVGQKEKEKEKEMDYDFVPGTCVLCAKSCFHRNVLCGKCAKEYGKYATWPEWLKELSRSRDRERYRQEQIREGKGEPLISDILATPSAGAGPDSYETDAYAEDDALDDPYENILWDEEA